MKNSHKKWESRTLFRVTEFPITVRELLIVVLLRNSHIFDWFSKKIENEKFSHY